MLLALRPLQGACRIDLREVFPADEARWDSAKVHSWNWTPTAAAEKLLKQAIPLACRWANSDSVDWVGALFNAYGVVMVDAKDNINQFRRDARSARIRQEAHGCDPPTFTPGTMPATTAGRSPARARAS